MKLSLTEVNQLAHKFMAFYDPSNTGQIDHHNFNRIYEHIYNGFSNNRNDQNSLRNMIDVNKDGQINYCDILVLCQRYFLVDHSHFDYQFSSPDKPKQYPQNNKQPIQLNLSISNTNDQQQHVASIPNNSSQQNQNRYQQDSNQQQFSPPQNDQSQSKQSPLFQSEQQKQSPQFQNQDQKQSPQFQNEQQNPFGNFQQQVKQTLPILEEKRNVLRIEQQIIEDGQNQPQMVQSPQFRYSVQDVGKKHSKIEKAPQIVKQFEESPETQQKAKNSIQINEQVKKSPQIIEQFNSYNPNQSPQIQQQQINSAQIVRQFNQSPQIINQFNNNAQIQQQIQNIPRIKQQYKQSPEHQKQSQQIYEQSKQSPQKPNQQDDISQNQTQPNQQLDLINRLFYKFDKQQKGKLDKQQMKQLIVETYKMLGRTVVISEREMELMMRLIDDESKGYVTLQDYQKYAMGIYNKK